MNNGKVNVERSFPLRLFFFGLKNLEMLVHQLYLMSKSHAPLIPCPKSSCCIKRGGKFLRLCEVKINCQEHHTPLATVRNPVSEPHPDSEIQPRMCGSFTFHCGGNKKMVLEAETAKRVQVRLPARSKALPLYE